MSNIYRRLHSVTTLRVRVVSWHKDTMGCTLFIRPLSHQWSVKFSFMKRLAVLSARMPTRTYTHQTLTSQTHRHNKPLTCNWRLHCQRCKTQQSWSIGGISRLCLSKESFFFATHEEHRQVLYIVHDRTVTPERDTTH